VITESKANGTQVEYTYGNDLLSQNTAVETLTYLSDALGSTRALADSVGNITDNYTYTPYGALLEHLGSSDNEFLFTGEQYGFETQNYYLRARYYSPDSGRFLSRDTYDGTSDSPLSQNHYMYTHGNPVNYTDPSGHYTMVDTIGAISIRGTFNGIRSKTLPFTLDAVGKMITKGILDNGQSVVVDLVTKYVFSALSGKEFKGRANVRGSRAHKFLEYKIGKYKPFGRDVTLKAEVFLNDKGNIPKKGDGRSGTIGIDIQVFYKNKLAVVMDLKTGSSKGHGFSFDMAKDHSKRNKGVPVIEIFMPFN